MYAKRVKATAGFSLIELLLVMGIFAVISSFAYVNLLRPQQHAQVATVMATLVSDLRIQQLKAMTGDTEGTNQSQTYGVYFAATGYTLFRGSTYNASDPSNFVITFDPSIRLVNITFPSSQVVFTRQSGDVTGFVAGQNTFIIQSSQSGEQHQFTLNRYGVVSVQ